MGSGFSSSDLLRYTERLAAISPEGTFPDLAELHGIRKEEEEEENDRLIRTRSGMRFHVHPAEKVDSTQVGFSLEKDPRDCQSLLLLNASRLMPLDVVIGIIIRKTFFYLGCSPRPWLDPATGPGERGGRPGGPAQAQRAE